MQLIPIQQSKRLFDGRDRHLDSENKNNFDVMTILSYNIDLT